MTSVEVTGRVPASRAARYRSERLWDDRDLADGIEAAAARKPGAVALVDNERRLTYAELERMVTAAVPAARARATGAVLVAGNTAEGVIAYHAFLRAGVTVVLLDRRCGPADVRHALAVLPRGAPVVVPVAEQERLLAGLAVDAIALERFGAPPRAPATRTWAEPDRDVAAVVMFTSGTTSTPKGVAHSINTLTAGANNMARIMTATDADVLFLVSPLTSITGVMQMHLAADRHACLVLEDHFDADTAYDRLNVAGATLLGGAPVIVERLLRAAERRGTRHITLRALALGGAMLPRPVLELATDGFGIEIARVYGSSEAPNFSGSAPGDDRERRLSDDGVLMPGSEVRVGSAGDAREGMLRGPGVFLGYVDAAHNAAAFEDEWYRTGDLVELHGERLTVSGRLQEVVNRNGLKISLAEVDAALTSLPGAIEHAAFGVPDADTGERLAVAVFGEEGTVPTLAGVVAHLRAQGLATRKLPEELVVWDGPLPRTPSGKVVRSRLVMEAPGKRAEQASRLSS